MYLAGLKLKSPGEILLGIAGAVGSVLLSAVGETAKYVGDSALGFMDSVGKGMFKAAQGTVGGVEKAGKAGISLGKGYWRDTNSRNGLKNPLGYMAHHGNKFVENNTKYTPAHATWDPYKGLTRKTLEIWAQWTQKQLPQRLIILLPNTSREGLTMRARQETSFLHFTKTDSDKTLWR